MLTVRSLAFVSHCSRPGRLLGLRNGRNPMFPEADIPTPRTKDRTIKIAQSASLKRLRGQLARPSETLPSGHACQRSAMVLRRSIH